MEPALSARNCSTSSFLPNTTPASVVVAVMVAVVVTAVRVVVTLWLVAVVRVPLAKANSKTKTAEIIAEDRTR